MSDFQFALPGLMDVVTPVSDALPLFVELTPHLEGTAWRGVDRLGPITINGEPPANPLVKATIIFSRSLLYDPHHCRDVISISSDDGDVVIEDAASWLLSVPSQSIALTQGMWYWVLVTVDTAGVEARYYRGTLLVRS